MIERSYFMSAKGYCDEGGTCRWWYAHYTVRSWRKNIKYAFDEGLVRAEKDMGVSSDDIHVITFNRC